jgi:hypothetical protein
MPSVPGLAATEIDPLVALIKDQKQRPATVVGGRQAGGG